MPEGGPCAPPGVVGWIPAAKVSFGHPTRAHARTKQTDYEPLLPVHHASRIGNVFLNTAKVVFQAHMELTRRYAPMAPLLANPRLAFARQRECGAFPPSLSDSPAAYFAAIRMSKADDRSHSPPEVLPRIRAS